MPKPISTEITGTFLYIIFPIKENCDRSRLFKLFIIPVHCSPNFEHLCKVENYFELKKNILCVTVK